MKLLYLVECFGRRGNCYWEVAALIGLAKKYGCEYKLPLGFPYREEINLPSGYYASIPTDIVISEAKHADYKKFMADMDKAVSYNCVGIRGGFQSYKYWENAIPEVIKVLRPIEASDFGEMSVGVHIRRGDYVNNPCYVQYPLSWYRSAIKKYFTDPRYRFYIVSDDYRYIQENFVGEQYVIAKRSDFDDFINLCACHNHILSGSSYSFWGSILSGNQGINVRVPRTHTGPLAHLDESTSWMPEWIVHEDGRQVVMMCYADNKYKKNQERLVAINTKNKQFDRVITYDRNDITNTEFYAINRNLLDEERGGGYWLWKPYLILQSLSGMEDGDILFYLDSGDIFFGSIREYLVATLENRDIILCESGNIQKEWTKRDCFVKMG